MKIVTIFQLLILVGTAIGGGNKSVVPITALLTFQLLSEDYKCALTSKSFQMEFALLATRLPIRVEPPTPGIVVHMAMGKI